MKRLVSLLLLFLVVGFFIACSDDFDVELPTEYQSESSDDIQSVLLEDGNELLTFPNGITLEYTTSGDYIMQGDILLADWQVEMITRPQTRGFISKVQPWTDGIIYYEFDTEITDTMKALVKQAVENWSIATELIFVDVTNYSAKPDNRISIQYGEISSSFVGMLGGVQRLTLTTNAKKSTIIHEFGHAIGLEHEHCRPDRDQFINVHIDNIQERYKYNFDIIPLGDHHICTKDFDPHSIMIYHSYTSDTNFVYDIHKPMITMKDGSSTSRSSYPTELDFEMVNQLYRLKLFDLKINRLSSLSGEVYGDGSYRYGTNCTIEAVANSGRKFVGWYDENNSLITKNNQYTFIIKEDRAFTAKFESSNGYCNIEVENPMLSWTVNGFTQIGVGGSVSPGSRT